MFHMIQQTRALCWPLQFSLICLISAGPRNEQPLHAAEWYVDCKVGNDTSAGTSEMPLQTIQRAVHLATNGDVIHLGPEGAVYRQSVLLNGKQDIIIHGHGVTLDGADPLPNTGWEQLANELYRRKLPRTPLDRHLLIRNGTMERMGRTQSSSSPDFPAPAALMPGQFCFENIDEQTGYLYVKGSVDGLEWSTRVNGLATSGENRNIIVRDLNARNFLNDGFNLHGRAIDMVFERITGYDCFDEGFSAHGLCQAKISDSQFWGNENGIADVNDCQTHYHNCEFRGNVNYDVLLIGKTHSLTNCTITNNTSAVALSAGPRGPQKKLFRLQLKQVQIIGRSADSRALVRINGGQLELTDNQFEHVDLNTTGATVVDSIQ